MATPSNHKNYIDLPYKPDELVFPTQSDDDLWQTTYTTIVRNYGEARVMQEHVRWAFEAVCDECQNSLTMQDFIRKVRLKWLWKRPPLPRGVTTF